MNRQRDGEKASAEISGDRLSGSLISADAFESECFEDFREIQ